jgi:NAD(P)-dependent dehydrogenase (short-subunit alcohol dehydrogenase family)
VSALEGRVALITGGAGGLGAATARALHGAGASIVIADIDEAGQALADEVDGAFIRTDVSRQEDNAAMVAFAIERFGGLDLVHLNAGVASGIGVGEEFDLERYRMIMGVNLDGVIFGTVETLAAMRKLGKGGSIVATASLAGLTSVPYDPLYAANKHAVVGLARSLGPALAPEGIRYNAICPGFSESAIIASFRQALLDSDLPIIPAEQVAEAVLELFTGEMSGECWFVQAGRKSEAFGFRNLPGPRHPA